MTVNPGLSSASLKKGTTTYYSATYDYDNVGNISSLSGTVPALNATFGYDSLYRLTSATYTEGKSYAYTYDTYGNLTLAKENNSAVFSSTYNDKNQLSNTGFYYDTRGNMTSIPGIVYEWNKDNNLQAVKNGAGTSISSNDYNERGLRYHARRVEPPAIVVTNPNGGQSYHGGAAVNITWNSQGIVGKVEIDYSTNNGSTWTAIIASTANDGSYTWTVPNTPSAACRVRVREIDDSPSDQSNAVFTILPPTITITSPNGGESWQGGSLHAITWTHTGVVGNVKIEYSTNNGSTWTAIISSTANDGSYTWTVPNTPSSMCLVRVAETDGSPSDQSNAAFTIPPPTITIVSPNGGESWQVGSAQAVTWTYTGVVGNVKIEYSTNSGSSWTAITLATANDGSYSWDIPDTPSSDCLVRVSETDGQPSDLSNGVFAIVIPPAVTVTSPNGGETWDVGSAHTITWTSQGMVGNVKIDYSIDNGSTWTGIISSTANDGSYTGPYRVSRQPHVW